MEATDCEAHEKGLYPNGSFCNSKYCRSAIFGWLAMRLGAGASHPRFRINLDDHVDGLYGYALVLSGNRTEAEDLVQETFLRAIRAMERLRPDSNVKSWLFTILRNIWLNEVRHRRTAPVIVELDMHGDGANQAVDSAKDPLAVYLSQIEREQVRTAIQQLAVEFREIILLREYEELSYQDIATMLKCPVGTVMSRLARARSKLRDLLPPTLLRARPEKRAPAAAIEAWQEIMPDTDSSNSVYPRR